MSAEDTPAAYVVGQTVKLLHVPEYGGWATGYIESASCGVYGVRVQGLKLHTVTAQHLEPLDTPAPEDIPARLEYLRGEIRAERISYGEIVELQGLAAHIDAGDVELLEWAGVPEFPEDAPVYGACGAEDCRECRPLFDADNRPIAGTEDAPFIKGGTLESTNPPVPAPGDTLGTKDGRQLLVQYTLKAEDGVTVYGRWIAEDGTIDALAAVPLDTLTEGS